MSPRTCELPLMATAPQPMPATLDDFLGRSGDDRVELIRGTLVEKPLASSDHSLAQAATVISLGGPFQRRPGGSQPGGWWFFTELPILFGTEVVRPDVCGFRRERMPQPPQVPVVKMSPDWTCEFISPTHEARDRIEKAQIYFRGHVPHYWLMNSLEHTLEVFRRTDIGYALVQSGQRGDRPRAEPFEAVEFQVDEFFGDDAAEKLE